MTKKNILVETSKALFNFSNSFEKVPWEFIKSLILIKKFGAEANFELGNISEKQYIACAASCNELLKGSHKKLFELSSLQGGAGTSINMNVNEAVSYISKIYYKTDIDSFDVVNKCQSTNDVNQSALRLTLVQLICDLEISVSKLIFELKSKQKQLRDSKKLARTHLQEAVVMDSKSEWKAFEGNIKKAIANLVEAKKVLYFLPIGGTAVGNGVGSSKDFAKKVIKYLNKETSIQFKEATNKFSLISSLTDFVYIASLLNILCLELSKFANDLRLLASSSNGGFGEIILKKLQRGSSIMPGKVNPVIPEMVNQMYFVVSGNLKTIELCAENSQLQLAVMQPVLIQRIIESFKISNESIQKLTECVRTLIVNTKRQKELVKNSIIDIKTKEAFKKGYISQET